MIILTRIKPEERVLVSCKVGDIEWMGSVNPSTVFVNCEGLGVCEACAGITSS